MPRYGSADADSAFKESFYSGTTSIEAADEEGWVVSVTPSGGWVPAVIAGRTGIGLSQRAQSFVTDAKDGPFNVIEPGKRPRVTLTPTLALKDGEPYPRVRRAGRRLAGPEPAAVLPERRRVRDDGAAGGRGAEHQQLPDALARSARTRSRPGRMTWRRRCPRRLVRRSGRWATRCDVRGADVRTDQRDPVRPEAPDDVGRLEQPRRGLRDRVVNCHSERSACPEERQRREGGILIIPVEGFGVTREGGPSGWWASLKCVSW